MRLELAVDRFGRVLGTSSHRSTKIRWSLRFTLNTRTMRVLPSLLVIQKAASPRNIASDSDTPTSTTKLGQSSSMSRARVTNICFLWSTSTASKSTKNTFSIDLDAVEVDQRKQILVTYSWHRVWNVSTENLLAFASAATDNKGVDRSPDFNGQILLVLQNGYIKKLLKKDKEDLAKSSY
jgi:hypothetical protein